MDKKFNWLAPLAAALLVACVGWWADWEIRQAMQQELANDLRGIRDADVTSLEIWMADQKRLAAMLAEEPRLRTLASQLLSLSDAEGGSRPLAASVSRQLIFGDRLQQRLSSLGYRLAQLVNTNFVVVLDSGRNRIGEKVAEELQPKYAELFSSSEATVIPPFKIKVVENPGRARGRPGGRPPGQTRELTVMQVATPIKDTNNVTCGALVLVLNPDVEFTRLLSVARSGESGETFAFDSEGVLISRSRFDKQLKELGLLENSTNASSALTLRLSDPGGDLTEGYQMDTNGVRPLMRMIGRALEGGSGLTVEPFRDYRGVPVIGAWNWLPKYGFGVGTKIDAHEAYRTLRMLRGVFVILFLLLVLASLGVLLFSYRQVLLSRRFSEAQLKARKLGQYQLVEKIGEGGMGVVYKAHHALLRRETALKLLPPHVADAPAVQRFEREVRLTCQLTHPNTIQVYDYGRTPEGIFYYAMEYLDGLTLADLVIRYGPQPEGRVIFLLRQICESLGEAHALGLVHRDIKPSNIFVCDRGGLPDMVKVLDFGLVKTFGGTPAMEDAADIVGTPSYMSPEAVEDPTLVDARSDLYSLGAVGYFLLTGQRVFNAETLAQIRQLRLTGTPTWPGARIGKPLCPHLEALVMRCLDRDPARRPQSTRDLLECLESSPQAADWTAARRTQWWTTHRDLISQMHQTESSPLERASAVDVEVTGRTP